MQAILQEFERIDSELSLSAFLQKNGFRMADSRSHGDQFVLGSFIGKIGESQAKVTHRLFDESVAAPGVGRNQLTLELDGAIVAKARFRGTY